MPFVKGGRGHLGGSGGTLNGILTFGSLNLFCFMVDNALDFRLVEPINDGVFALRDIDYMVYGLRGSFGPRRGKRCAPRFT